jgi:hypothetical protein
MDLPEIALTVCLEESDLVAVPVTRNLVEVDEVRGRERLVPFLMRHHIDEILKKLCMLVDETCAGNEKRLVRERRTWRLRLLLSRWPETVTNRRHTDPTMDPNGRHSKNCSAVFFSVSLFARKTWAPYTPSFADKMRCSIAQSRQSHWNCLGSAGCTFDGCPMLCQTRKRSGQVGDGRGRDCGNRGNERIGRSIKVQEGHI